MDVTLSNITIISLWSLNKIPVQNGDSLSENVPDETTMYNVPSMLVLHLVKWESKSRLMKMFSYNMCVVMIELHFTSKYYANKNYILHFIWNKTKEWGARRCISEGLLYSSNQTTYKFVNGVGWGERPRKDGGALTSSVHQCRVELLKRKLHVYFYAVIFLGLCYPDTPFQVHS